MNQKSGRMIDDSSSKSPPNRGLDNFTPKSEIVNYDEKMVADTTQSHEQSKLMFVKEMNSSR